MSKERGWQCSLLAMQKERDADADRRHSAMRRDGCCGDFSNVCEDGFCMGVGWCPTHAMARRIVASFEED